MDGPNFYTKMPRRAPTTQNRIADSQASITSKNKSLDYEYLKLVNTEKLIFIKSTNYIKKKYELDFNNGTITINQQPSSDETDKKTLSKLIKQAGSDLKKNLAAVEAVDRLEVD